MGLGFIGDVIGGLFGRKNNKDNNSANLQAARETNNANREIAAAANQMSLYQMNLAYRRDTGTAREARRWDAAQVQQARKYDAGQVQEARRWNQSVALEADRRDRSRFLEDRAYSENQARLAEQRERANFLENRGFETDQFFENRQYTAEQALAAEQRQRGYQQADLADARAYADPAAERARLEAAGFNPLGRSDSSSGMNNIGGAIANAPAALLAPSGYVSPAARAAADMGMSGSPVAAAAGSAASQIARSQMAKFGVFDPAVAHMTAPQLTADNSLGEGIADAFQSIEAAQIQEKEYALRKSQAEIEEQRLSELMQRATMRPIVGGVYSREVGVGRSDHLLEGGSSSPRSPVAATSGQVSAVAASDAPKAYHRMKELGVGGGYALKTDPGISDAEDYEQRYGDVASSVAGIGIAASDVGRAAGNAVFGGDKARKAFGDDIKRSLKRLPDPSQGGRVRYKAQRDVALGNEDRRKKLQYHLDNMFSF